VAQAISPTGQWGKVWLAAHFDKKLKKEDFMEANIPDLCHSILKNSKKLTLRYMGNFLLGLCKVYAKQSYYFEEHGRELHDSLMMAFSHEDEKRRKARADYKAGEAAREAAIDGTEKLVVDEELQRLLASRKHLARMEEITLKPAIEDALKVFDGISDDTFGATSEGDAAALLKLTKQMKRTFPGQALPIMSESDSLMPLVEIPSEALATGDGHADPLAPLDMDLDPMEDGIVDMGGQEGLDEEAPLVPGAEQPHVKRRRRAFMFDDPCEIPKEVYQGYMNDRSAITRKDEFDSTIFLPNHCRLMPEFMTTYTDMCNSLVQGLSWGAQVAERRRTVLSMAEASAPGTIASMATEAIVPPPDVSMPIVDLALDPVPAPIAPESRWEQTAVHLDMSDAPSHMTAVVQGGPDQEEQAAAIDARVGYSGRTEKMHKFLAKEFQSKTSTTSMPDSQALSYEQMCRSQSSGDRGVIAGCFFELLVLRTNGVVNLRQESPYSDIQIEKSRAWGTTSS
jgi:hypothetical protein